jgi:chaperonin GroES
MPLRFIGSSNLDGREPAWPPRVLYTSNRRRAVSRRGPGNAMRRSDNLKIAWVVADIRSMEPNRKQLIVVGDRVLISPEAGEDRSRVGLYLPPSAVDNQAVQGGEVVATGPGTPISAPTELDEEPWKIGGGEARYMPVQARVGDYAIFFRRAAVEITFEEQKYLVIPQAAILALVRETVVPREEAW